MTTSQLLIHIGYHKTGTTWIQNKLFLPEHGYRLLLDQYIIFNNIVRPHGLTFDPDPARKLISNALDKKGEETAVISSETLSGHPFFGGRESDVFAARLASIAPDARILISIRNQLRILPSVYMQYLLRGGTMNHIQFFEGKTDVQYPSFSPEHFEYHYLIQLYQKLFGKERVFVLTNESLRRDRDTTLRRLAEFAGNSRYSGLMPNALHPIGESYPEYAAPILRRINHIQKSTLNPQPIISFGSTPKGLYKVAGFILKKPPLSKLLRTYKPVSAHVKHKFEEYFQESNQALLDIVEQERDLTGYVGIEK